jgi:hypothetical protein
MDKRVLFFGQTEQGVFAHSLFGSAGVFEKTAGAPPFADWETGDELRGFIKGITKADRRDNCYVLVNALGAGEFFGSNINADYFEWDVLSHPGADYGYRTFLNAHVFQHHKNKDPTKAFGVPVLSVLNHPMKRVELITKLNRAKAKIEGADGIIHRIDTGDFPDVSMGCRVPYDVCSICGNKSKTKNDYCQHMRPSNDMRDLWGPNKILADGRKIFVRNPHARFFDLSFVFIGADKTAKAMAKLASKGNQLCLGSVCAIPSSSASSESSTVYGPAGEERPVTFSKVASACDDRTGPCGRKCAECADQARCETDKLASAFGVKVAGHSKLSEILKEIPAGAFSLRSLPGLAASEPDLPTETLDAMAEHPLPAALGTASSMGIVLKPREFQRIVLIRMGEQPFADELDAGHQVFAPSHEEIKAPTDPSALVNEIVYLLSKLVAQRSAFQPHLTSRNMRAKRNFSLPTPSTVEHPLLSKVSAAYNGYRRDVLLKLSQAKESVQSDPTLWETMVSKDLVNMFSKTASSSAIVDLDSVAYLMGAHLSGGLLSTTAVAAAIADSNPWLLTEPMA